MNLPNLSSVTLQPEDPSPRRQFLTPIPGSPGEFLLVLDNTALSVIKRCHQAARNYLLLGREAHAKTAALTFGGAIHEGLEVFHKNQYYTETANAKGEPLADYSPAVQDAAVSRFFQENPGPPDEYRTLPRALEVLKHYRHRSDSQLYPDYEWEILADASGPIIERAFELPLDVLEFPEGLIINGQTVYKIHLAWSGRIDLLTRDNQQNQVTDHKTSSIDGEDFVDGFILASQTIGYVWTVQQLYPQFNISRFCLNCLRLKRPTGNGSIVERGPKGGEPALKFFRCYYDYTPERIEEWKLDTILTIEDFLHSVSRNRFPLNDFNCFQKYGRCQYHSVCTIDDPEVRDRLLLSDSFKSVTWNPTTGR